MIQPDEEFSIDIAIRSYAFKGKLEAITLVTIIGDSGGQNVYIVDFMGSLINCMVVTPNGVTSYNSSILSDFKIEFSLTDEECKDLFFSLIIRTPNE